MLCPPELVAHHEHRRALRQQQHREVVLQLLQPHLLPLSRVMMNVGHDRQVVEGQTVVSGDEVDAEVVAAREQIGTSLHTLGDGMDEARFTADEPADLIAEAIVPLQPGLAPLADLIRAEVPRFGNQPHTTSGTPLGDPMDQPSAVAGQQ
jgi:hypothetical protein